MEIRDDASLFLLTPTNRRLIELLLRLECYVRRIFGLPLSSNRSELSSTLRVLTDRSCRQLNVQRVVLINYLYDSYLRLLISGRNNLVQSLDYVGTLTFVWSLRRAFHLDPTLRQTTDICRFSEKLNNLRRASNIDILMDDSIAFLEFVVRRKQQEQYQQQQQQQQQQHYQLQQQLYQGEQQLYQGEHQGEQQLYQGEQQLYQEEQQLYHGGQQLYQREQVEQSEQLEQLEHCQQRQRSQQIPHQTQGQLVNQTLHQTYEQQMYQILQHSQEHEQRYGTLQQSLDIVQQELGLVRQEQESTRQEQESTRQEQDSTRQEQDSTRQEQDSTRQERDSMLVQQEQPVQREPIQRESVQRESVQREPVCDDIFATNRSLVTNSVETLNRLKTFYDVRAEGQLFDHSAHYEEAFVPSYRFCDSRLIAFNMSRYIGHTMRENIRSLYRYISQLIGDSHACPCVVIFNLFIRDNYLMYHSKSLRQSSFASVRTSNGEEIKLGYMIVTNNFPRVNSWFKSINNQLVKKSGKICIQHLDTFVRLMVTLSNDNTFASYSSSSLSFSSSSSSTIVSFPMSSSRQTTTIAKVSRASRRGKKNFVGRKNGTLGKPLKTCGNRTSGEQKSRVGTRITLSNLYRSVSEMHILSELCNTEYNSCKHLRVERTYEQLRSNDESATLVRLCMDCGRRI